MKYELIQKLKDTGYPLTEVDTTSNWCLTRDGVITFEDNTTYRIPSLSELIEACGEEVVLSNCKGDLKARECTESWLTEKWYGLSKVCHIAQGKTPEEAVAKLWIELNEK